MLPGRFNVVQMAIGVRNRAASELPTIDAFVNRIRSDGTVQNAIAIIQNVTAEVEQQKKLDALHLAGRELANLEADLLAEMNVPTRIELLKQG